MLSNSPDKLRALNSSSDDLLDEKPLNFSTDRSKLIPCKKTDENKKVVESGFES